MTYMQDSRLQNWTKVSPEFQKFPDKTALRLLSSMTLSWFFPLYISHFKKVVVYLGTKRQKDTFIFPCYISRFNSGVAKTKEDLSNKF